MAGQKPFADYILKRLRPVQMPGLRHQRQQPLGERLARTGQANEGDGTHALNVTPEGHINSLIDYIPWELMEFCIN